MEKSRRCGIKSVIKKRKIIDKKEKIRYTLTVNKGEKKMSENKEFNFREFILKEEIAEPEEKEKTVVKRAKPVVEFNVEWSDHCDAIISRKTKSSIKYLALLVSQKQYYIKDNKDVVVALTTENLNDFMKGCDDGITIDTNWMSMIPKGKVNNKHLIDYLENDLFCEMAKMGIVWLDTDDVKEKPSYYYRRKIDDIDWNNALLKEKKLIRKLVEVGRQEETSEMEMKKEMTTWALGNGNAPECFGSAYGTTFFSTSMRGVPGLIVLKNLYGESGVSQLATMMAEQSKHEISGGWSSWWRNNTRIRRYNDNGAVENIWNIVRRYDCKFDRFAEYIVYEPARQGYSLTDLVQTWYDTLAMQKEIYGKVREKYPEDLASLHQRLSYRCNILAYAKSLEEKQTEEEKAGKRYEELKKNCYSNEKDPWIITVPMNVGDILEEAQNQSNCLASYVKPYVTGSTDLYFMRDKKKPEESLITIEIKDGCLRQAYAHHNNHPKGEEMVFIEKWCKKKGFTFTNDYHAVAPAND